MYIKRFQVCILRQNKFTPLQFFPRVVSLSLVCQKQAFGCLETAFVLIRVIFSVNSHLSLSWNLPWMGLLMTFADFVIPSNVSSFAYLISDGCHVCSTDICLGKARTRIWSQLWNGSLVTPCSPRWACALSFLQTGICTLWCCINNRGDNNEIIW